MDASTYVEAIKRPTYGARRRIVSADAVERRELADVRDAERRAARAAKRAARVSFGGAR